MSSSVIMEKESTSKVYSSIDLKSEPPLRGGTQYFQCIASYKVLNKKVKVTGLRIELSGRIVVKHMLNSKSNQLSITL